MMSNLPPRCRAGYDNVDTLHITPIRVPFINLFSKIGILVSQFGYSIIKPVDDIRPSHLCAAVTTASSDGVVVAIIAFISHLSTISQT